MNDKQFDRAVRMLLIAGGSALLLVWLAAVSIIMVSELNEPTAPTYHCDGPGYPAPGTTEARACWIEESK